MLGCSSLWLPGKQNCFHSSVARFELLIRHSLPHIAKDSGRNRKCAEHLIVVATLRSGAAYTLTQMLPLVLLRICFIYVCKACSSSDSVVLAVLMRRVSSAGGGDVRKSGSTAARNDPGGAYLKLWHLGGGKGPVLQQVAVIAGQQQ